MNNSFSFNGSEEEKKECLEQISKLKSDRVKKLKFLKNLGFPHSFIDLSYSLCFGLEEKEADSFYERLFLSIPCGLTRFQFDDIYRKLSTSILENSKEVLHERYTRIFKSVVEIHQEILKEGKLTDSSLSKARKMIEDSLDHASDAPSIWALMSAKSSLDVHKIVKTVDFTARSAFLYTEGSGEKSKRFFETYSEISKDLILLFDCP